MPTSMNKPDLIPASPADFAPALLRREDLARQRVRGAVLNRQLDAGLIERVGRGLYRRAGCEPGAHASLAEASRLAPRATVCLLSALAWHGLTTQLPAAVWLQFGHKDRIPTGLHGPVEIVRATGPARTEGVMQVMIDGVPVPITTPAKTVADCFKHRARIGLDVAIEALRDGLASRAFTPDQFLAMADACRVAKLVRPYLEALA
jgi:predicted transcriptional regulator of viral defense system